MPYKDPEIARIKGIEYNRRWVANHPEYRERRKLLPSYHPYSRATAEAHAAQQAVYRAIRNGALVRSASCSECGIECKPEAAHEDYSKPLDIRWLCRLCHRREDSAKPKGGTTTAPRPVRIIKTQAEKNANRAAWARADRAKKNTTLAQRCVTCGHNWLSLVHRESCLSGSGASL